VTRARLSPFERTTIAAAAAAFFPLAGAFADQTVQVGPGTVFSPATVTVAPGETVTWQFQELHTSTSDSQTGPEMWDSGFLASGTFAHTFQTPGTYPYYCAIHSSPGGTAMNGVVVVSGAGTTPTATPSPVVTVTPTSSPGSPTATPIGGTATPGIPDLDAAGRVLLAFTLAAIGVAALLLTQRR
jgi:plastocyanin